MSTPDKPPRRRTRLFPRALDEVVKSATKPLMDKQGKLYDALLRDWLLIVGQARARVCKPQRLQFATGEGMGATLHLSVRPAVMLELNYELEQMLEQCARYFGYRAVTRIVLHHDPAMITPTLDEEYDSLAEPAPPAYTPPPRPLPDDVPPEMRAVLERISKHVGSKVVKKPSGS